jgi:hypothetical protein
VSAIITKNDWDVPELYLETGRLDEVFRSLTQAHAGGAAAGSAIGTEGASL